MSQPMTPAALEFFIALRNIRKRAAQEVYRELSSGEFCALFVMRSLQQDDADRSIRVASLVEKSHATPQAVSKMLRTLETKGYIVRHVDPSDRRSTRVTITQKGSELLHDAQISMSAFAARVMEKMGDEDSAEFIRLTNKCAALMEETVQEFYEKEAVS